MELVKVELDAIREAIIESNDVLVNELAELNLAMAGGGSTDVQFC